MKIVSFFKKIFSRQPQDGIFRSNIEKLIGHKINHLETFIEAFTHRSASKNNGLGKRINYERLEFLGDAVLGAVIAHFLYEQLPNAQEGYLTQMRSKIVNRKNLNHLGEVLGLQKFIRARANEAGKDILGDVLEALIGAIYKDQGYEFCEKFIREKIILPNIELERLETQVSSYKSLLIEWCQKNRKTIKYQTFEEENAEDAVIFCSILTIDDQYVSKGRATSKKSAEELASKRAYFTKQNELDAFKE